LLGVADPSPVWEKLHQYVTGGGKLFIAPGRTIGPGYRDNPFAKDLLPATFGTVINTAGFDGPANPAAPDPPSRPPSGARPPPPRAPGQVKGGDAGGKGGGGAPAAQGAEVLRGSARRRGPRRRPVR